MLSISSIFRFFFCKTWLEDWHCVPCRCLAQDELTPGQLTTSMARMGSGELWGIQMKLRLEQADITDITDITYTSSIWVSWGQFQTWNAYSTIFYRAEQRMCRTGKPFVLRSDNPLSCHSGATTSRLDPFSFSSDLISSHLILSNFISAHHERSSCARPSLETES